MVSILFIHLQYSPLPAHLDARAVAALAEQRVAIAMVSCGHQHTAVVTDQGQLWT